MRRLPSAIIIGGMKCGTTSLYRYLDEHPMLRGSRTKEPSYFSDLRWDKGLEWYKQQFSKDDTIKFEASTIYTKYPRHKNIARRMSETLPECKLIYIVRHPVERLLSQILHNLINGTLTAEQIINSEFRSKELPHYMNCSRYYLQITQYLPYYPREQILILKNEDLRVDASAVLKQTIEFIEVPFERYKIEALKRSYNTTGSRGKVRSQWIYRGLKKLHAIGATPGWHTRMVERITLPEEVACMEFQLEMWDEIKPDLDAFEREIGIELGYDSPARSLQIHE